MNELKEVVEKADTAGGNNPLPAGVIVRFIGALNRFWFEPVSPSPVCVFRILYGLLCIANGLLWRPDFLVWFGQHGVLSVATLQRQNPVARMSILLWLNPDDPVVMFLLYLYILAGFTLTLGFCTRLSNITVFFLAASFFNRNPWYWHSADGVLRILGLQLIFAPAGAMYSIDSWLKRRSDRRRFEETPADSPPKAEDPPLFEPWAQRLIQLQLCSIYWKAFWGKVLGETWRNGTAVYYASHLMLWYRTPIPAIYEHLWSIKALTWGTLFVECSLWSLIWCRKFRYWVILVGIVFHGMIHWDMRLDVLEVAAVGCYVNFIDPAHLEWCISSVARLLRRPFHLFHAARLQEP